MSPILEEGRQLTPAKVVETRPHKKEKVDNLPFAWGILGQKGGQLAFVRICALAQISTKISNFLQILKFYDFSMLNLISTKVYI